MALDPTKNFLKEILASGYSLSATAITVADSSIYPNPAVDGQFNLVWWNITDYADPSDDDNKEIVRVISRSGNIFTITRAQEGTTASAKNTSGKSYAVILAPTSKMITDINTALETASSDINTIKGDITTIEGDITQIEADLGVVEGDITGLQSGKQNTLGFTPENVANKENTTLDTSATKYPTNRLVKEAVDAKQNTIGYTTENVANKSTDVSADGSSDVKYPSVKAIKDYADALVIGAVNYRSGYDASVNTFPTTGGSGTAGAVRKGNMWIISVAGTLGGEAVNVGDSIIANVNTPGQTVSNWNILNSNITYVPEDVANKTTSVTGNETSNTKYPTVKSMYDWATGLFVAQTRTITINGVTQDLSTNRTWTISVPTLISQLTNDSGFITSSALSGYVPTTRTLTINGTTLDLSADRSWTISSGTASTGLTNTSGTWTANLSTGISGGQSAIGGTASGNNLTLSSTSHATKGKILFGSSAYDEVNIRLGIGTQSPSAKITISDGANNVTFLNFGANNTSGLFTLGYAGGTMTMTSSEYGAFNIATNGGNQNINLVPSGSGKVGIGTTSPGYKLDVNGNFNLPNTTSATSGGIYFGGNRFISNYGTENTYVGSGSGPGNFTATGNYNTGVGAGSFAALTSGNFNMAFGRLALGAVTSGQGNVGIGNVSFYSITTQSDNTGVGSASGYAVLGSGNTFIGSSAGRSDDVGTKTYTNNTFIGSQAGYLGSTSGISNATAIGYNSQVTTSNSFILGNASVNVGIGMTASTARLQLPAGTATASSAPLKFTSGTNLTTAEAGAFEYNGTNLFFTRTGTTRQTVLTANVVTTEVIVSDTSVTVNIAGTDYKLLARA